MKIKHLLTVLLFSMTVSNSFADDGLVIQFTISEEVKGSNERKSYTNAVLMRFDEEVSFDLDGMYVLKVRSRPNGQETVDLLVSLKDVIDGKPYYVGAKAVTLKIGDSADLNLNKYETAYSVSLDTSYGKLP